MSNDVFRWVWSVTSQVCVPDICFALCTKVAANSWKCGCWMEEIVHNRKNDCSQLIHVRIQRTIVCYAMLMSSSQYNLRLCVCVSSHALSMFHSICAPPACIFTHQQHKRLSAPKRIKPSTFCALRLSKDWGHLLAMDTAGGAIWGRHTPPVPPPSIQGSSHHLVSVPVTEDTGSCGTSLSETIFTQHWATTVQTHPRNGRVVYIFRMFTTTLHLYLHVTATPLSGVAGMHRWGGAACQINGSHTEREHRPTVAAPWFICHLALMKLQTAGTHTHTHHSIFLHQSPCWFVCTRILFRWARVCRQFSVPVVSCGFKKKKEEIFMFWTEQKALEEHAPEMTDNKNVLICFMHLSTPGSVWIRVTSCTDLPSSVAEGRCDEKSQTLS